jgi:hypothetical protein
MVRNRIYDIARDEDNAPIVGASVSLRRLIDNGEITYTSTDASGGYGFDEADVGYPGPVKVRVTGLDGVTRERTGKSTGQTGTYFHSDLMRAFSVMNNGVVGDYDNELAATGDGLVREVAIDSGLFFIQGHPLFFAEPTDVTITANASGNPRIDLVVVSFTMPGEDEEGKAEIIAIAGTPAGSPVAPSLTQTTALWQESLAQVAVANGASAISQGNITDTRTFSTGPLIDGSIESVHLADGAVTNAKVATAIDAVKLADGSVTNTEFQYISTLTSNAQTQISAKADTVHTHLLVAGATDVTASATELNVLDGIPATLTATEIGYSDGVTSAIQTQLDGKAASSHNHAGAAITSGTVGYAYLPTGTASSTVAIGDHTHTGVYANSSHAHAGADITSGTVAYARLPTGTASSTVAIGDHNHSGVYATSAHSHSDYLPDSDSGNSISWSTGLLVIDASAEVSGLEIYNDVTIHEKIILPESVSPPALTIGSAAGTGGSAAVSIPRGGSDTAGQIRVVCGTSSVGTGTLVTLTFDTEKADTNYLVLLSPSSSAAAACHFNASTKATTGFPIVIANTPANGAQIDIDYLIVEVPAP